MTTENISLFQALGTKMNYLQERQKVISQNVSNANTPGYAAKDLSKIDFRSTLSNVLKEKSGVKPVTLAATEPGHMGFHEELAGARVQKDKAIIEVAPNKNGVVLEEQMMKASDTQMNFGLLANVYTSNMSMIRTALGRRN